jgi:Fic family protein
VDIFQPPKLRQQELDAVQALDELRTQLRYAVSEPRRWLGGLRRLIFAKAVQGSNSIEGYNASLDDVLAAVEDEEPLDAATETKLALQGYRDAMTYVLQLKDEEDLAIDTTLLRSLHYMMMKYDLGKRPGRWRGGGIWVQREPENVVVYEAPDVQLVPDLMSGLADSLNGEAGPVVVRAAMAHLNLVMIHPFSDGNGRMGRCLQTLVLTHDRILAPVFCSIEEYLGANTQHYYDVLADVGRGSWHPRNDARPWVRFCLNAHYQQARTTQWRIRAAEELWERCEALAYKRGLPPRVTGPLCDAAQGLRLRNAIYRDAVEASEGYEVTDQTASNDLRKLVKADLLVAVGETRGRVYHGAPDTRAAWGAVRDTRPKPEHLDLFGAGPEQLSLMSAS